MTSGLDALFEGKDRTLTVPEVADLLGLTKQAVYHWLRDGVIPGYKVGSTWFILRDELKGTLQAGANLNVRADAPQANGSTKDAREE
jgi:excisionase family DNA binding protein